MLKIERFENVAFTVALCFSVFATLVTLPLA